MSVKPDTEEDKCGKKRKVVKAGAPAGYEDIFMKVNKPRDGEAVDMDSAFLGIFETIVVTDIEGTYKRLTEALKVGEEGYRDIDTLRKALNMAEFHAREAHGLWLTAKLHRKRFEISHLPIVAKMREAAREMLEREAAEGSRKKSITIDDVTMKAAGMFNDEFVREEMREYRAKGIDESMENLSDVWKNRCKTLSVMLTMARKSS